MNVSRQAINDLVARGKLTLDSRGCISLASASQALAESIERPEAKTLLGIDLSTDASPPDPAKAAQTDDASDAAEETQTSYHVARALRETFEAKLKRLRFDQESGASIELPEAQRIVFTAFRTLRDQILNVPARIKDQVAAESDPVRVENMIEAEIVAALNAFDPDEALQDTTDDDEPR